MAEVSRRPRPSEVSVGGDAGSMCEKNTTRIDASVEDQTRTVMGSDVRLPCAEEEEEEEAEAGQTFGLGHARLLLRRTMAEYIPLSPPYPSYPQLQILRRMKSPQALRYHFVSTPIYIQERRDCP